VLCADASTVLTVSSATESTTVCGTSTTIGSWIKSGAVREMSRAGSSLMRSKDPLGKRSEGVLEFVPCEEVQLCHGIDEIHLTPLTGPRASFHKVLPSPLVVRYGGNAEAPFGRQAFAQDSTLGDSDKGSISAWGELCPNVNPRIKSSGCAALAGGSDEAEMKNDRNPSRPYATQPITTEQRTKEQQ